MNTDKGKHGFLAPSFTSYVNLSKVIYILEHEFPHVLNKRIGQMDLRSYCEKKKQCPNTLEVKKKIRAEIQNIL